jgi:hypothetical protein
LEKDHFDPESILTDFEAAIIYSVDSLLPNVLEKGNSTVG